jgi:hypothetical protein
VHPRGGGGVTTTRIDAVANVIARAHVGSPDPYWAAALELDAAGLLAQPEMTAELVGLRRLAAQVTATPGGCAVCGRPERGHGAQHRWQQPEDGVVLARMQARRLERLSGELAAVRNELSDTRQQRDAARAGRDDAEAVAERLRARVAELETASPLYLAAYEAASDGPTLWTTEDAARAWADDWARVEARGRGWDWEPGEDGVLRQVWVSAWDGRPSCAAPGSVTPLAVQPGSDDAPVPYVLTEQATAERDDRTSPAGQLAEQLAALSEATRITVETPVRITVQVHPRDLESWRWWLSRFEVRHGAETHRGETTTATGRRNGVEVHLVGHGVAALYVAEAPTGGETP